MQRIETDLGRITHNYFWQQGLYWRQSLSGGRIEYWNGRAWIGAQAGAKAA